MTDVIIEEQGACEAERTVVLIKPDGIEQRLVGKILARIEELGFTVRQIASVRLSVKQCRAFYPKTRQTLPDIYESVERHMTSGISIAVIVEGADAVQCMRDLRGPTNLLEASPGTIRKDFITDEVRELFQQGIYVGNLMHTPDNAEDAVGEIALIFGKRSL